MAGFELTPEEIKLFFEEAVEQIQLMEESLIALEEEPDSSELIQSIFRAAHTLKGGAATAGFDNIARLTHVMESLLDLVRQGEAEMSTELADRLFEGVDVLRAGLVVIDQKGTDAEVDVTQAINSLTELMEMLTAGPGTASAGASAAAEATKAPEAPSADGAAEASPAMGLVIKIAPDAAMPAVRAYQALLVIEDHTPIVQTEPERGEIESGASDARELTVYVASGAAMETIVNQIKEIPEIIAVEPLGADADVAPPSEAEDKQAPADAPTPPKPKPAEQETPRSTNAQAPAGGAAAEQRRVPLSGPLPSGGSLGQTIRVDVRLLDTLMNLVGELVIDRTRLAQLGVANMSQLELQEELIQVSNRLSRVTGDLQDTIMQARMMPIDMLFKKFPRMIRDLSRQLNKPIRFEMSGEETELDRSVIEQIGDPLIHLLRNAVDHGIEPVEERRRLGKSEEGVVSLSAYHQENHIYIEVADDGRGIDIEKLKRKAIERGVIQEDEAERLSDMEAAELIFAPGISTAADVSTVSGRGVGMDVVKRNVERVNGSITLETAKGRGTRITIKLPLTLAILQALMVEIVGHVFAVPLSNVTEVIHIYPSDVHRARGWEMVQVRGEMVPLLNPAAIWGDAWRVKSTDNAGVSVVVLNSGSSPIGVKVDRLLGEQEIVIKTMGPIIGNVPGISGASILGDGRVALIVDPAGLSKAVRAIA